MTTRLRAEGGGRASGGAAARRRALTAAASLSMSASCGAASGAPESRSRPCTSAACCRHSAAAPSSSLARDPPKTRRPRRPQQRGGRPTARQHRCPALVRRRRRTHFLCSPDTTFLGRAVARREQTFTTIRTQCVECTYTADVLTSRTLKYFILICLVSHFALFQACKPFFPRPPRLGVHTLYISVSARYATVVS